MTKPTAAAVSPDGELIAQARAGHRDAFELLMRRHERRVLAVCRAMVGSPGQAEDAAQEVFLRLYRHLNKIDPARGAEAWLVRVAMNVCRDMERQTRNVPWPAEEPQAPVCTPEQHASEGQRRKLLFDALRQLPPKERGALVLRDIEGLPTAEVAQLLGSSETTVRSQISSARLKLRWLLARLQGRRA